MTVAEAFAAELARGTEPELLPERLARACVAALPVDGAGLTHAFSPERRLPLGAGDVDAAVAERVQFALGDGPCLEALRRRRALRASAADLGRRWPVYAAQLSSRTPYNSVLALAVGGPLATVTAIDLYATTPELPDVPEDDLTAVAELVGEVLADAMSGGRHLVLGLPEWFHRPAVVARQRVWLAIGRLSTMAGSTNAAALAVLRARAFRLDLDLETAADRYLDGTLAVD